MSHLLRLFLFATGLGVALRAADHDAALDFSTSTNPTGVWSYGSTASLGGAFSLLGSTQNFQDDQVAGWSNGFGFPFVMRNVTGGPVLDGTTEYPAATVALHPSNAGEFAVLRWTAPTTSLYQLSLTFADIPNDAVATVDVHALLNSTPFFQASLGGAVTSATYANALSFAAGDQVDFVVGYGGNGFNFDHTAVQASLTAIPEPATTAPMIALAGLAGAIAWRRRRSGRSKRAGCESGI